MFIKTCLAALLGFAEANVVPLHKKELTMDMIYRQLEGVQDKFLGEPLGADVQIRNNQNAQYFVETMLGTPGQQFTMVPDTGSSNVWVYAHKCFSIVCWTHPTFDNSLSSTYVADGKPFVIQYGSGGIKGTQAKDVVTLGGSPANMGFGEITEASGISFLASKMSGIIGLAYKTISVNGLDTWMDLNSMTDKSFTFFLHNNPTASYMTFPGTQITGYAGQQKHNVVEQKYWALNLSAVSRGSVKIPITGYKGVIDSGTSLLVGPKLIIDELIKDITVNGDCSNLNEMVNISFWLDEIEYVLTPNDYVLKVEATQCTMGIAPMDFPKGFDYFIVGDVFMRKYPTTFNLNDNTVTFQTQ